MQRKTKIIATLGPATHTEAAIFDLLSAGVDVVRLNFSHGSADDHVARARMVRAVSERLNKPVAILCDLQGPKIRIGKFGEGGITLQTGDLFALDAACQSGDQSQVGLDYPSLPDEIAAGAILLLDDGRITMRVQHVKGTRIQCEVLQGGFLSDHKGINLKGGGLATAALTDKDKADIKTAVALHADYIAVSFPKDAAEIEMARALLHAANGTAAIVAKIERAEAIDNLASIIQASDAIMVARGDLGVEVGDAAVPGLQKRIIRMASAQHKPVITATQMMESMIHHPLPTRAEVSDVANAVLDGTDAVMLSAETATGHYPVETVRAVDRICLEAEKESQRLPLSEHSPIPSCQLDEAIALAALFTAKQLNVRAIAALTQTGNVVRWLSGAGSQVPIFALSPNAQVRRKLMLYRNVYAFPIDSSMAETGATLTEMTRALLLRGLVASGDTVLFTYGEPHHGAARTNTLKVVEINDPL